MAAQGYITKQQATDAKTTDTLAKIRPKAIGNINEITRLMKNIMEQIDSGEGSLGALLKDRQLYDRLNRAARNVEQVSRELRPIVEDAGVFMDKAARHPGGIIRDAI